MIIKTDNYIYALELKLNIPADVELNQILEKGYLEQFAADKRKKLAIGVSFSSEERLVKGYLVKEW